MSRQADFLRNLVALVRSGKGGPAALGILRGVCRLAIEKAPARDLVAVAECLLREAGRTETGQN